jgi:hypothetical protein
MSGLKTQVLLKSSTTWHSYGNRDYLRYVREGDHYTPVYHIIIISVTILLLCESSESVIK